MLERLVSEARAELATTAERLALATKQLEAARGERDHLRLAYQRLFEKVELLRRRIYAAKAERVNPLQLEIEFKEAKDKLDKMAAELEALDKDGEQAQSNSENANGWEESSQFGYQRPGRVRIVTARAKYKTEATESEPVRIVTAPLPRTLLFRSILAPSLLAHKRRSLRDVSRVFRVRPS